MRQHKKTLQVIASSSILERNNKGAKVKKAKTFANYDWDDNILFMPTRIIYFAKDASLPVQEIAISTEGFAKTRNQVNKEDLEIFVKEGGPEHFGAFVDCEFHEATRRVNVKDYAIMETPEKYSFREFRDHDTENLFIRDVIYSLTHNRLAPSFHDFVEHCGRADTASQVTIITARGQSPETIHAGLEYLKDQGIIAFVPPLENIFPVSSDKLPARFKTSAATPQNAKINVLCEIMDNIEKNHAGSTFGFSDDDKKTFDSTKSFMEEQIKNGRWTNFEINLYFTGHKTKDRHRLLVRKTVLA